MRAVKKVAHKGESYAAEVAAAAETCDNDIGIFAGHSHLLLGLKTDNCLV